MVVQRKYSLDEIDRMRTAMDHIGSERADAENRLRTYMFNGTGPEELEARAAEEMRRRASDILSRMDPGLRESARLKIIERLTNAGFPVEGL